MVNQIEKNIPFAGAKSDVIATHLKKFWTPQMRSDIFKEIQAKPNEFSADVREALAKLHQEAKA